VKDAKAGDYRARDWLAKYLIRDPESIIDPPPVSVEDRFKNAPPELIIGLRQAYARLEAHQFRVNEAEEKTAESNVGR
jgi:hypothetical protein